MHYALLTLEVQDRGCPEVVPIFLLGLLGNIVQSLQRILLAFEVSQLGLCHAELFVIAS